MASRYLAGRVSRFLSSMVCSYSPRSMIGPSRVFHFSPL
jgi:hypothetical protein